MFKQRLITALILIPLVLFAIQQANGWILAMLTAICLGLAAYEWAPLIPITSIAHRLALFIVLIGCTYLSWMNISLWLWGGLAMWLIAAIAVMTYPASSRVWGYPFIVVCCCLIFLPLTFTSICAIYNLYQGKDLIIYLLFLVWAADSGAYLVGKQWGRHRLIPHVSPGKTVEGAFGGLACVILIALLGYFWFKPTAIIFWYSLAILVWLQAMFGDLFFSMLKRRVHLKDTGHLIPGHGGVLDRLDSLIAVAPLFYAGMLWANSL